MLFLTLHRTCVRIKEHMMTTTHSNKGIPKSVGSTLSELLAARNLNQTEAATKLSLTRPYLNGIINGKYTLSTDLKTKLKSLLNVEPDFWTSIQTAHDLWKSSPEGKRQLLEQGREELYNALDLRGAHVLVARVLLDAGVGQSGRYLDGDKSNLRSENLCLAVGSGTRRDRYYLRDCTTKHRLRTSMQLIERGV